MYNLEHDQADNQANAERLRNDLHDLSCKVALRSEVYELTCKLVKMAQTVDDLQETQHAKERNRTQEKTQEDRYKYTSGDQIEGERRRSDKHRGG